MMAQRFPETPILPIGISMGAAALLMAADDMPDQVCAILADCGYVTPWEELAYVARHNMGRAAVALLPGVDLWCRLVGRFRLKEKSAAGALAGCGLPVMLIHGKADELVPWECSAENARACRRPAETFFVDGADHGMSFLVDPGGYRQAVGRFLNENLG